MNPTQIEQLSSLVAHLRQVREAQAVSLEDIAAQTYIQLRLLRALDRGDYAELPEPVFIRGFIRRYADCLGLDGVALSRQFSVGNPLPGQTLQDPPLTPVQESTGSTVGRKKVDSETQKPDHGSFAFSASKSQSGSEQLTLPEVPDIQPMALLEKASPASDRRVLGTKRSTSPLLMKRGFFFLGVLAAIALAIYVLARSLGQRSSSPTPTTQNSPAASPTPQTAVDSPAPTDLNLPTTLELEIVTTEEVWMAITVDGEQKYEGVLPEGETQQWKAKDKIEIQSGNAGGLTISINGDNPRPFGGTGEVKTATLKLKDLQNSQRSQDSN